MTAAPAMTAPWVDTTLVFVGAAMSPGHMPRSTLMFCGTSVTLNDTLDASTGMPQIPATPKTVGVLLSTGLLVARVSNARHGVTV